MCTRTAMSKTSGWWDGWNGSKRERQTAIRKPKHLIPDLEPPLLLRLGAELLDGAAEFDAEDLARVGGERVFALALEEVHAV
jgi:hypothetical protein